MKGKDMIEAESETKTLARTVARQILLVVSDSSSSHSTVDEAALTSIESVIHSLFFFVGE